MKTSIRRTLVLALLLAGCSGPSFSAIPDASDERAAADGAAREDEGGAVVAPPDRDAAARGADGGSDGAATEDGADSAVALDGGEDRDEREGGERDARARDATGEAEASAPGGGDAGAPADASDAALDVGAPADGAAGDGSAEAEACAPVVYYLDGDGDGYGGTTMTEGCAPPDGGAWVSVGGDCDDSNATVNPGQTAYFTSGYVPAGKTVVSFDYDCDGVETESGDPPTESCAFSGLSCVGSGYVEASPTRSGLGVDPYCGSAEEVTCSVVGLSCEAGTPYAAPPIACH